MRQFNNHTHSPTIVSDPDVILHNSRSREMVFIWMRMKALREWFIMRTLYQPWTCRMSLQLTTWTSTTSSSPTYGGNNGSWFSLFFMINVCSGEPHLDIEYFTCSLWSILNYTGFSWFGPGEKMACLRSESDPGQAYRDRNYWSDQ